MANNIKKKIGLAKKIIDVFKKVYAEAECTLCYDSPLQLLIATQLAAQCTDARVNLVTPELFSRFKTAQDFAQATEEEISQIIHSTGFYRNKAKNIIACCKKLVLEYDGVVPQTMEELLKLPGVGRKTANLVLGDIFNIPGIVVDTHAGRLSRRMGLTANTDPYKIEMDLLEIIPPEEQSDFCHRLVLHGREYCSARKPRCEECPIGDICPKIL